MNKALSEYRFDEAANFVYQFFWGDFCDWYLEIVKVRLDFNETTSSIGVRAALTTLLSTFEAALRLLSPFMPFITEELWHAVYDGDPPAKSIALSRYPQALDEALDDAVEDDMATLQQLIVTIRGLRKELDVPEREEVAVEIFGAGANPVSGSSEPGHHQQAGARVVGQVLCGLGASFYAFEDDGELYSWLPV